MHSLPQRRNAAYLNRGISRFGQLGRDLDNQALQRSTGLAIDLDGSLKQPFRPDEPGGAYLENR
jgi:hypothetical protein